MKLFGFTTLFLVALCLSFTPALSRSTAGRRFIAGFGLSQKSSNSVHNTYRITVTALDKSALVRIRGQGTGNLAKFTVAPFSSHTAVITNHPEFEADLSGALQHNGVEIRASNDVVVTVATEGDVGGLEATLLLPRKELRRQYELDILRSVARPTPTGPYCFQVVASNNNVQVKLFPEGQTFTLPQRLDSVSICMPADGSYLEASKDVAVFSFNPCTSVRVLNNECSFLFEQILPNSALGKSAVVLPFPINIDDLAENYRAGALFNDTDLIWAAVGFGTQHQSLQAHQISDFVTGPELFFFFQADKTTYFHQYFTDQTIHYNGAPMNVVPAIERWLSDYVVTTQPGSGAGFTNYLLIAIRTDQISSLRINGSPLDSSITWSPITNDGPYSGARFVVNTGAEQTYHIQSTTSTPFEVVVFGVNAGQAYSFFGGQSF